MMLPYNRYMVGKQVCDRLFSSTSIIKLTLQGLNVHICVRMQVLLLNETLRLQMAPQ